MKLTADYWIKYINTHTSANKAAERRMERYIAVHGTEDMDKLADYAYALVSKYGEAASALSCEMYDQMARAQNANVPEAVPAETASYGEVSKAVRGAGKTSPTLISDAVGRLVKQAGADTTLQNAARDGAYFAWIAHGDTCPYCMALAAIGWQKAGKLTLKGGHAEHIHANCDCEYAIDHTGDLEIEGYDPYEINQQLLDMTDSEFDAENLLRMSGHNGKGHDHSALNIIRRKHYAANKDYINAQKRAAYARRTVNRLPDNEGQFKTVTSKMAYSNDNKLLARSAHSYPDNEGMFENNPRPRDDGKQTDIIKPRNIMKAMNKSEAGKEALEYINKNSIPVLLLYNVDVSPTLMGEYDPVSRMIIIYASNTKSAEETALTTIHEAMHARLGGKNTRRAEVLCRLEELKHTKRSSSLTLRDYRSTIKIVNRHKKYSKLPWR